MPDVEFSGAAEENSENGKKLICLFLARVTWVFLLMQAEALRLRFN